MHFMVWRQFRRFAEAKSSKPALTWYQEAGGWLCGGTEAASRYAVGLARVWDPLDHTKSPMPRALQAIVMLGTIAGLSVTIITCQDVVNRLDTLPSDEGRRIELVGEGVVFGKIEFVDSFGPFRFDPDQKIGSHGTAGQITMPEPVRTSVLLSQGGIVRGEGLRVEMKNHRGIAYYSGQGPQSRLLETAAKLTMGMVLLAASLTAARGDYPISRVLYLILAFVVLLRTAVFYAYVPGAVSTDMLILSLVSIAVLVVLGQPGVWISKRTTGSKKPNWLSLELRAKTGGT
ncbi:MAG: hypothetical protein ABI353_04090 [Isosphaeraceae bacterium]